MCCYTRWCSDTWGVVGSLVTVWLQMFPWFWQWNKFENRSIFDEIKVYKTKDVSFCTILYIHQSKYTGPKIISALQFLEFHILTHPLVPIECTTIPPTWRRGFMLASLTSPRLMYMRYSNDNKVYWTPPHLFNVCIISNFSTRAFFVSSEYGDKTINNNNNNNVIYTAQIRQGRKCAFSREFWRVKFSVYL